MFSRQWSHASPISFHIGTLIFILCILEFTFIEIQLYKRWIGLNFIVILYIFICDRRWPKNLILPTIEEYADDTVNGLPFCVMNLSALHYPSS